MEFCFGDGSASPPRSPSKHFAPAVGQAFFPLYLLPLPVILLLKRPAWAEEASWRGGEPSPIQLGSAGPCDGGGGIGVTSSHQESIEDGVFIPSKRCGPAVFRKRVRAHVTRRVGLWAPRWEGCGSGGAGV